MTLKELKESIIESPSCRTVFGFVVPLISGVLSGIFVNEITSPTGILWNDFYKAHSFYALIVLGIVIFLYNRALYLHEKELMRFLDSDYCIAYMRSKCLPEAAERYKSLIRSGGGGELKQAMDELKKVLK